ALSYFKMILEKKPFYPLALHWAGICCEKLKKSDQMIAYYQKYLESIEWPNHKDEVYRMILKMAAVYEEREDYAFAIIWIDKLLGLLPGDEKALKLKARILEKLEDWKKSYEVYLEILHSREDLADEENYSLFRKLGFLARKIGRKKEAIYYFEKVLGLRENDFEVLEEIGDLEQKEGHLDEALSYFEYGLKIAPKDLQPRFYEKMARIAQKKGEIKLYLRYLHRAYQGDPTQIHLLQQLIETLYQERLWKDLIYFAKMILSQKMDSIQKSRYLYYLGTAYFEEKKEFSQALEVLNQALELNPANIPAYKAKILIHSLQKDWEAMVEDYQALLVHQKEEGQRFATYLKLGQLYQSKLKDPQKSVEYFEKALNLDPQNYEVQSALTSLYADLGDTSMKAQTALLDLLKDHPMDLDMVHRFGKLLQKEGKRLALYQVLSFLDFAQDLKDNEKEWLDDIQIFLPFKIQDNKELEGFLDLKERFSLEHQIFSLVCPYLQSLYPSALERFGSLESLSKKDYPYLYQNLKRFEEEFGVLSLEFARIHRIKLTLLLENTTPPKIIFSQSALDTFSPQEITPLLGSFFYLLEKELVLVFKLSPTEMERLFIYLVSIFFDNIFIQGMDPQRMTNIVNEIKRNLPRKIKRELEPLINEFWLHRENHSPSDYFKELHLLSQKFGLLFSQNLGAYINAILKVHMGGRDPVEKLNKEERLDILQSLPGIQEILIFAYTFPWDSLYFSR
ncbi:MAG: hypothetical protein D6785_03540, partial [Planctomycetota bacterium]